MSQTETQPRYRIARDCHDGTFKVQVEGGLDWFTIHRAESEAEARIWLDEERIGDTVIWEQPAEAAS